jgi:hypothetical protein
MTRRLSFLPIKSTGKWPTVLNSAVSSYIKRQTKINAGWSSPVARQAHNLKAAGSNPAPATKSNQNARTESSGGRFAFMDRVEAHLLDQLSNWEAGYVIPQTAPCLGIELNDAAIAANPYIDTELHLTMADSPVVQ